jgi:hypothetical protein
MSAANSSLGEPCTLRWDSRWSSQPTGLNLVALYRALGGGWELREGNEFVSDATKARMRERTDWGDLLRPEEGAQDINAATADVKNDRGQWQWREWTPKW